MRKIISTAAALLISLASLAQTTQYLVIVPDEDLPKPENFLPGYAEPGDSLFFNDSIRYVMGKSLRDTPRGELAKADASTSVDYYLKRFGQAMGNPDMNSTGYPAMAELVNVTLNHARNCNETAKHHFKRERPYSHFNEHGSSSPFMRKDLTSYPSGHTVRAWAIAMALVGVDPEHQDEILKVGFEIGQSRIILGFHYQSDIDAAIMSASAAFARICVEPAWIELFQKAKAEFESQIARQP